MPLAQSHRVCLTDGMSQSLTVQSEQEGQRLDVWCVAAMPGVSRAQIQKLIKDGAVTVNGDVVKPRHIVRTDDVVDISDVEIPTTQEPAPIPTIPVLFEDDDVVVIDKPPGVAAHPGDSVASPTVSAWFADRYPDALVGDEDRPGIVHRLDRDTSGVMILAKTPKAFERLKEQFKKHRIRKEYVALAFGIPGGRDGRIVQPIGRSSRNPARRTVLPGGKPAITEWSIDRTFGNDYTLMNVLPFTGRTHQIRVHLHHIGYPIVGDALYTFKKQRPPEGVKRQLLHAKSLMVQLPSGKKKTFEAPLPQDFLEALERIS